MPIYVVVKVLTGRKKLGPSFFQASHILDLAEAFEVKWQALLAHHTVFPYATAFMEPRVYGPSLISALATGKAASGIGATIQSVSDHVRWRQYCIECSREDILRWGESYWHRAHNLPGVLVCTIHGSVLRRTTLRTSSGGGSWSYQLPQEAHGTRVISKQATGFDVALAQRAVNLLNRSLDTQPECLATLYREDLVTKGLLSSGRQVDTTKFVRWARDHIGASPTRYGFNKKDAGLLWLALMLRHAQDIPFTALKHTVLQTALDLQQSVDKPIFNFSPVGYQGRLCPSLDRKCALAVRQVTAMHLKAGLTVRVSDALALANCRSPYKHNRGAFPKTQSAVMELRESAASVRRVGATQNQTYLRRGINCSGSQV